MKLSHSKLSTILTCPMSYYLKYIEGIEPIQEKSALAIGSAVHWGIEHNTEDLTEYYGSEESEYTREQLLSEAMVHGYFKHKDEIFNQILTNEDGSKLNLIEESHEVFISANLQSKRWEDFKHEFIGIIDLLLLTDKGFIIVDYKTSTYEPDWNNYLDQIYRYIFLVQSYFPETPIIKIGIINLKKTAIRQKKNENYLEFLRRLKLEYDINDEQYVCYHEFKPESLDKNLINSYLNNLASMCDTAKMIDDDKLWYINFSAANGQYGKSPYWDIFYKTPDAYLLYKINDKIYNEETDTWEENRPCVVEDLLVVEHNNVINHYNKYLELYDKNKFKSLNEYHQYLLQNYICNVDLLDKYKINFIKENEKN